MAKDPKPIDLNFLAIWTVVEDYSFPSQINENNVKEVVDKFLENAAISIRKQTMKKYKAYIKNSSDITTKVKKLGLISIVRKKI